MQLEKLRVAHAREKKEAMGEFKAFKRMAKEREENIQVHRVVHAVSFNTRMSKVQNISDAKAFVPRIYFDYLKMLALGKRLVVKALWVLSKG